MADLGTKITCYLALFAGVPSGAPDIPLGATEWVFGQNTVTGDLYFYNLHTPAWEPLRYGAAGPFIPTSAEAAASGVATLDSGVHVPLAQLSGITTSQLAAAAGIVAGQIASVNPSALTGSGTVPSAGLPKASSSVFGAVEVDGTTITAAAGVISAAAAPLTVYQTILASDVALTSAMTWYDVLSLSLPAGTYLFNADATFVGNNQTPEVHIRIWDGTNYVAAGSTVSAGYGAHLSVANMKFVVSTTTTYTLCGWSYDNGFSVVKDTANTTGGSQVTHLTCVKIA